MSKISIRADQKRLGQGVRRFLIVESDTPLRRLRHHRIFFDIPEGVTGRPALLVSDQVTLPIQINGKRRGEITVPADMGQAEVEQAVLADEAVQKFLNGQPPKKLIVVPGRIVNVVA